MAASAATDIGTLQLGVAGCGRLFERCYLPALARCPGWKLVAACDASAARRHWVQQARPGLVVGESLSQLLAGSRLDALFVATPPDTHCRLTLEALAAGLHVLVEKPMALNGAEARQISDAADRAGRELWVGFTRRFRAPYRALKAQLAAEPVSGITALRCHMSFPAADWHAVSGYLGDAAKGGGVLHDVASHQLDLLAWLLGQGIEAIRVRDGSTGSRVAYDLRFQNHLVAQCVAEHDGRYREHVQVDLPGRILTAHAAGIFQSRSLTAAWTEPYGRMLARVDGITRRLSRRPNLTVESFARQFDAFAMALRGGTPDSRGADAQEGAAVVGAIDAACRARLSPGQWVDLLSE